MIDLNLFFLPCKERKIRYNWLAFTLKNEQKIYIMLDVNFFISAIKLEKKTLQLKYFWFLKYGKILVMFNVNLFFFSCLPTQREAKKSFICLADSVSWQLANISKIYVFP